MEADALKARLISELSAESVEVSLDGDRAAIIVFADVSSVSLFAHASVTI